MNANTFWFPTEIQFGCGQIQSLSKQLAKRDLKRPLIVTDQQVAKLDFFHSIEKSLRDGKQEVQIFCEFSGNPLESHVKLGAKAIQAHRADSIVAIGGGAAIDVAKAITILAHHPGNLFDYEEANPNCLPFDSPMPRLIAVPTTAGTGSEVGRSTVISEDATKAKKILFSPRLLPELVIADPELTFGLPPKITAATGMDALTHCIEAYLSPGYHPMCDGIAWEGVRLIGENLVRAVDNGNDVESRSAMLSAAMMGAVAFQKGLGINHSCAHALSTVHDLHHGLANAILLPHCMQFNLQSSPQAFARLALAVGKRSAEEFVDWLVELNRQIAIPKSLSEYGISEISSQLIQVAWEDPCHQLNPRKASKEDFETLFQQAL